MSEEMEAVMAKLEEIKAELESVKAELGSAKAKLQNEKPETESDLMDIKECARYTGFKVPTLYCMTHEKTIPHFKVCGRLRFSRKLINEWYEANTVYTKKDREIIAETYTALNRIKEPRKPRK